MHAATCYKVTVATRIIVDGVDFERDNLVQSTAVAHYARNYIVLQVVLLR